MRAAFKGLEMDRLDIAYSVAKAGDRRKTGELVIRNW